MVDVTPAGPIRGYAHPGCYLSADMNCSEDISREHFISESILEIINISNGGLVVSGFPWLRAPKDLPPRALASNILCKRHNERLSGLDSVALRFYRHLSGLRQYMIGGRGGRTDKVLLFSGNDLERWMLKVLCGVLVSGNAAVNGEKAVFALPTDWIDVLTGRRLMPAKRGLGVTSRIGEGFPMDNRIGFAPLYGDGMRPVGALMSINGLGFSMELANIPNRAGTSLEHVEFRPGGLLYEGASRRLMFKFAGEGWDDGRDIVITWQPDPPGGATK